MRLSSLATAVRFFHSVHWLKSDSLVRLFWHDLGFRAVSFFALDAFMDIDNRSTWHFSLHRVIPTSLLNHLIVFYKLYIFIVKFISVVRIVIEITV